MDRWNPCCSIWSALGTCAEEFMRLYSQTLVCSGCLPGKMSGKLLPWMNLESSSMLSTAARAWAEEVENAEESILYLRMFRLFVNWAGDQARGDGGAEMTLRTFYSRIPFQIKMSVPWGMGRDCTTSEANISSVSQYNNYRESGAELKLIPCRMWFTDWWESVLLPLNRLNQENQVYHETAA